MLLAETLVIEAAQEHCGYPTRTRESASLRRLPFWGFLIAALLASLAAYAEPPEGYYAAAQGKAGSELRYALHLIIRNHRVIPYSSSAFDTSDALRELDVDAVNTNNIIGIYSRLSEPKTSFGLTSGWNREHLWPDSYGLDGREPAYSDLQNLRAEDMTVNSERANKFFDVSSQADGGYKNPAHSEALLASCDNNSWQPPAVVRGDIARAMFYMATRYTGDVSSEPALYITESTGQISGSTNLMGRLSTLLAWHAADPVDASEQLRNDRVYGYQLNRNPFVDHPEWVNLTFAPPATNPPRLSVSAVAGGVLLEWPATNQASRLEYATHLGSSWLSGPVPKLTNGVFRVTWTNTVANQAFFRLSVSLP
jgi:endonuclease I